MKKHLYATLLMAICTTSLFAQTPKSGREVQGEERNMTPQTESGGYTMRNQMNQAQRQAAIEGAKVKVTAPDGQIFYGRILNGGLKLKPKDMQIVQKSIKMSQPGDMLTLEVGGVTAQYRVMPQPGGGGHGPDCCPPIPIPSPFSNQESADRFAEGKRVVVIFSQGDQVEMRIKNRRVEFTPRQRQMVRDRMETGRGEVQINIADGGMIINGSVEGVEGYGCFLVGPWCWILADLFAMLFV